MVNFCIFNHIMIFGVCVQLLCSRCDNSQIFFFVPTYSQSFYNTFFSYKFYLNLFFVST